MKIFCRCLIAVCAGTLTGMLNGCTRSSGTNVVTAPVLNVQTVHPHTGEIVRSFTLPGNVRAFQEVTLYAKVAGYLKTIAVDKGDAVKKGDLIAEIEAPEMLADLARVQAAVEATEIEYTRERDAQKNAPDLIAPQTVDTAKGKYDMAKADLKRVQELLVYSRITAPFSGIITRRWVDPGAFIPAATSSSASKNAAVAALMDFSRVRVDVAIPQTEAPLVQKDQSAVVTVEELAGRAFEGKVSRFAYALDDSTKTMPTEIELQNPDRVLRPGMFASVKISLEHKADALLIPAEALIVEKKKTSVFTVTDGKAKKVEVRTGFDDGISVEVVEGLSLNDLIILAGKQAVADGQTIQAAEAK